MSSHRADEKGGEREVEGWRGRGWERGRESEGGVEREERGEGGRRREEGGGHQSCAHVTDADKHGGYFGALCAL